MTGCVLFRFLQNSHNCRLFCCFRTLRLQFGHQFLLFFIHFQLRRVFLAARRLCLAAAGRASPSWCARACGCGGSARAERGLSITGSVLAAAAGLGCSVSCGTFLDQRRLAGRCFTAGPPGESRPFVLLFNKSCLHGVLGTHMALGWFRNQKNQMQPLPPLADSLVE